MIPLPAFHSIPKPVYGLLRIGRTTLLWLAEPFDLLRRHLAGRSDLPPLWLRRHVGSRWGFERAAREMARVIEKLQVVKEGDHVLDVGCGTGVMAKQLVGWIGPGGGYLGFDVHRGAIRWCQKRFGSDPRFRFELAHIASPYGASRGASPLTYRFPMADGEAQFILAKSVFTHLLEPETRHYLAEIQRTLHPGRAALITAFLFERDGETGLGRIPFFPFADGSSSVRWRFKARPHAAVAFERSHFVAMVEDAGLRVQWLCPGFWPGREGTPRGQDILLLGH